MRRALGLGSLLFALAVVGCGPSADQKEARQVVYIIDRVRDAKPEQRKTLLAELERASIKGADARRARQHCTTAYGALLEGQRLESEARQQLAYPSPSPTLVADLAEAERKVDVAATAMPRCNEALGALRRLAR